MVHVGPAAPPFGAGCSSRISTTWTTGLDDGLAVMADAPPNRESLYRCMLSSWSAVPSPARRRSSSPCFSAST
jgi:hypothetical protein